MTSLSNRKLKLKKIKIVPSYDLKFFDFSTKNSPKPNNTLTEAPPRSNSFPAALVVKIFLYQSSKIYAKKFYLLIIYLQD